MTARTLRSPNASLIISTAASGFVDVEVDESRYARLGTASTFTAAPQLANTVSLQGLEVGGAARNLIRLDGAGQVEIGASASPLAIRSAGEAKIMSGARVAARLAVGGDFAPQTELHLKTPQAEGCRLETTNADTAPNMRFVGANSSDPVALLISRLDSSASYFAIEVDPNGARPALAPSFDIRVAGGRIATLADDGTAASVADTIMTRRKGDARYQQVSSSRRYKENEGPAGRRDLSAIQAKTWTWGGELPADDPRRGSTGYGIIAEDVEAVFPEAVRRGPDGDVEGLDGFAFIGAVVEELRALNQALETRCAALEARVAELEAA